MQKLKIVGVVFLCYAAVVVTFESLLGYFQPTSSETLKITTYAQGEPKTRVVNKLYRGETLYVAANHWPRSWYYEATENSRVGIKLNDEIVFCKCSHSFPWIILKNSWDSFCLECVVWC